MKFSAVFALCCIVLLLAANIEAKQFEQTELASFTDFAVADHLFAPGKAIKGVGKVGRAIKKGIVAYNKAKAGFKADAAVNHQGILEKLKSFGKKVTAKFPKIKTAFKKPAAAHQSGFPKIRAKKPFVNGKGPAVVNRPSIAKKPSVNGKGPARISSTPTDQEEN